MPALNYKELKVFRCFNLGVNDSLDTMLTIAKSFGMKTDIRFFRMIRAMKKAFTEATNGK